MKNYELFNRDPRTFSIPNKGVAKIYEPTEEKEWETLRFELTTFVCKGGFEEGLNRILYSFLSNIDQSEQPGIWVSGFYGSGKSHIVRVLEYLWRDVELPDGATARSLVNLPTETKTHLKELITAGKREGGLWAAAGTLSSSAGDDVRLAILAIMFRAAGFPEEYALAKFVLWLIDNGYLDDVKNFVESKGKDFDRELHNLYVSKYIADGLLETYPDWLIVPLFLKLL